VRQLRKGEPMPVLRRVPSDSVIGEGGGVSSGPGTPEQSAYEKVKRAVGNWSRSVGRRVRRRYQRQTPLGHVADVLGMMVWGYCIWFVDYTWFGTHLVPSRAASPHTVAFMLVVTMVLRVAPKRWVVRKRGWDEDITTNYAAANEIVTQALRVGVLTEEQFERLVACTLQAIVAEMARKYNDVDGTYFNSFLWEEDQDPRFLRIIGYAKWEDGLEEKYKKIDLLTWRAMEVPESVYSENRQGYKPWGRYRAVAAFPLKDLDGNVVAGVSVKSVRPHHFDGDWEAGIYALVQQGLSLLVLALECRDKLGPNGPLEQGEC
jgi:hypothetical protein